MKKHTGAVTLSDEDIATFIRRLHRWQREHQLSTTFAPRDLSHLVSAELTEAGIQPEYFARWMGAHWFKPSLGHFVDGLSLQRRLIRGEWQYRLVGGS
jgi:hypothetical protein